MFFSVIHLKGIIIIIIIISSMPEDEAQLSPQVHSNQCDPVLDATSCEGRRWLTVDRFQRFRPMSVVVFLWVSCQLVDL